MNNKIQTMNFIIFSLHKANKNQSIIEKSIDKYIFFPNIISLIHNNNTYLKNNQKTDNYFDLRYSELK